MIVLSPGAAMIVVFPMFALLSFALPSLAVLSSVARAGGSGSVKRVRILGISGSLQAASANLSLLQTAQELVPEGVELLLFDGIRDLPLFNPDLEAAGVPPSVETWRRAIADSDALLIASPEYGYSLPGALKNAIDWVIGSGELERKLIAVTASTTSPERGVRGLQALLVTLAAVKARIIGGTPIARSPSASQELKSLLDNLIAAHNAGTPDD